MEKLIKQVNDLGYPVALNQYSFGTWRWDAIATRVKPPSNSAFMEHIAFGNTPEEALKGLLENIKAAGAPALPDEDFSDLA